MTQKSRPKEDTHTVLGRPVIDGVPLRHETPGASDYCMHCGVDMTGIRGKEPCEGLENARRKQISPLTVLAFGCDLEAKYGHKPCDQWCQGPRCPYTRATPPQGDPHD